MSLALALVASAARAAECRDDAEQRLTVLADAFDDQVRGLDIWSWSWGSIYVGATVAQAVVAATLKPNDPSREDLIVGTVASAAGALSLYLLPLRFTVPLRRMRGQWGDADRCRLLEQAEATRTKVAAEQRLSASWLSHAGNVLFNVAIGLTLGLAFGHWKAGAISGGIGIAVGELNLFTQPTHLGRVAELPPVRVVPIAGLDMQGVGVAFAF